MEYPNRDVVIYLAINRITVGQNKKAWLDAAAKVINAAGYQMKLEVVAGQNPDRRYLFVHILGASFWHDPREVGQVAYLDSIFDCHVDSEVQKLIEQQTVGDPFADTPKEEVIRDEVIAATIVAAMAAMRVADKAMAAGLKACGVKGS